MEELLFNLKDEIEFRKLYWENSKDPRFVVSIMVCNRRIQKLDEALKLIAQIELLDEETKA